jgi:hypothetical protein
MFLVMKEIARDLGEMNIPLKLDAKLVKHRPYQLNSVYKHKVKEEIDRMWDTYHSSLRYLVNKPVLGGNICRCLLLFQVYDFEVIMKPRKLNLGPNHFSHILSGEDAGNLDDKLPYAHLFAVRMVDD